MRALKLIAISLAIVMVLATMVVTVVVPIAVQRGIRTRLEAAGYADAVFSVGRIGLDRVELLDLSLQRGLDLGNVSIEAGPYHLWRGTRADVVVRGARIDLESPFRQATGTGSLPFGLVHLEDSVVIVDDERLSVRGTIDLRGRRPAVDLVAHTNVLRIASNAIEDVAVTLRGTTGNLRACATGQLRTIQLDACLTLDPGQHRSGSLVWAAHDEGLAARGLGTLRLENENLVLEHGTVDATLAARDVGKATLGALALQAEVTADLTARSFAITGELRGDALETHGVVLRDVVLPIDLHGVLTDVVSIHSDRTLVATTSSATLTFADHAVRSERSVLTASGLFEIPGLRASANTEDPLEITTTLHGVSVDHFVAMATRDHVRATGLFDGELVFGAGDHGLALLDGSLRSRGSGTLRAADLASVTPEGFAIHRTIAAALADFTYSKLDLAIGQDSTVHVSLAGHGNHVPQELSVDIDVRGLVAQRK